MTRKEDSHMHLYADIYDADGTTRLGGGAVRLIRAEVTHALDGIGRIALAAPGTDARAQSLIQPERRVRLYAGRQALGRGVIRQVRAAGTPDSWRLTAEGADELDALTRVNTLLGRAYRQGTPAQIGAALTGLIPGWTFTGSGGASTDARFDGMSVWRALTGLADAQGLHVRAGTAPNTIEMGAFGEMAGVRLTQAGRVVNPGDLPAHLAVIERIEREQSSEAAATRLYPVGAGIGEALLTLERSTRTAPYPIQAVTGADGRPQYYLQDAAGAALVGVIERFGKFRQIAPLSNAPADLEHAADALYDLAAAWLRRYAVRQETYRVTVRGFHPSIRPGAKVRVTMRGAVERGGLVVDFLDIDADLWVMRVTHRADSSGLATDLLLTTVDRHAEDESPLQIGRLESITIDGVQVTSYFNRAAYVYDRLIDPQHPAVFPVRLTDATQRLVRCTLRVRTRPFTVTATAATGGAVAGLGTNSVTLEGGSGGAGVIGATHEAYTGAFYWRTVTLNDAAGNPVQALVPLSVETGAVELRTEGGTGGSGGSTTHSHTFSIPDHTHPLTYGLAQDTVTPSGVRLAVNGTDVTDALGGAWAVGGGAATFEVDITTAILAGGDLQRDHAITLTCGGGRGSVEIAVEIYEVIAAIAV
ncbi:MAG: hypothetical protein SF162_17085 [bacterium]|nr:hypothetical protein [bacterium]